MKRIEARLKEEAKRLLETGEVAVVLAYGRGYDDRHPMPCAAKTANDVERIVFNEYCTHNMARYLLDYPPGTRIAIAAKGCDSRAVVVLLQEEKIRREDLVILGIPVAGMKDPKTDRIIDVSTTCGTSNPVLYDILLGEEVSEPDASPYGVLEELEGMDGAERWAFWGKELSRCIRCYACRQACPMCYCDPCFVDQAEPRWAEKSPSLESNLMFHLTRFYHLAGRCVDCGECSRACPMEIPLYLFHKKVARECEEMFGQAAGMSADDKPVILDFRVEDSDEILL
jgi:formate dehydrogenase (coenzyme F420) beta subunit